MAEQNLHIIYRISDKGHSKPKLPNAGKGDCLINAVNEFDDFCRQGANVD